jgi:hypothetical protein
MRIAVFLIAVFMGGWMIIDGACVMIFDKYIGPDKPGPWADIIAAIGLDPMRFGLVFIVMGIDWIVGGTGVLRKRVWGRYLAGIIAFLSLWYFPVGTLMSILTLVLILLCVPKSEGGG